MMLSRRGFSRLAWVLVLLTWCVAMLGAYVRLSDAGLGCPDWPGCYGYIYAPHQSQHLTQAAELFPHSPVHVAKAWKEMIHRYAVSILSLGILVLFGW
jgi:heme a synthase